MSTLQKFNQIITNPKTQKHIEDILGEKKQSFISNITSLVAKNASLQQCEPLSLMYAAMSATTLDLPLDSNLGFAYVIPFKDNKAGLINAQFQIGYKGFIQLAIRSGQFKTINVREVKEGELLEEDFISGEMKFKKLGETERETAKTIGYVAFIRLLNGFEKTSFWSIEKVTAHAKKFSQSFRKNFGLWKDDFDAMAKKTVLKLLLSSYAPLSVEMQQIQKAVQSDQAVFIDQDEVVYIDNKPEDEELTEQQTQKATDILETAFSEIKN